MLESFPENIPKERISSETAHDQFSCPVSVKDASKEETGTEILLSAFRREISELRLWYELGIEKRGYIRLAYFSPDSALRFFEAFLLGERPKMPDNIDSPALALRLASQDLKAFYFESALANPGTRSPGGPGFDHWFWQETVAGKVLRLVRQICLASDNDEIRVTGGELLVPLDQR